MLVFDFLEANTHLVRAGAWDEFENAAVSFTRAIPNDVGDAIDSLDLSEYTRQLEAMLDEASKKVKKSTKALYWEFDVDNEWYSSISLTESFHYIEAEWASDEQAWVRGPDLAAFDRIYKDSGSDPTGPVLARLAARTFAAFGRAFEQVGFHDVPVGASFHDSDYIVLMPRPGVDLEKEIQKAEAAYRRVPKAEWIIAEPRQFHLADGESSHDAGFGSVPGLLGTFWSDAQGEWTREIVTVNEDIFRDTYIVLRCPLLVSERIHDILVAEAGADDALGWLEAVVRTPNGDERPYWYPHFTRLPRIMVKAKVEWQKGKFVDWTVLDPERAEGHRVLPFMKYAFDSWGESLLIHQSVAKRLANIGIREFRWKPFALTTDRRVREIVSPHFATETELEEKERDGA